jgi:hypothetical protein
MGKMRRALAISFMATAAATLAACVSALPGGSLPEPDGGPSTGTGASSGGAGGAPAKSPTGTGGTPGAGGSGPGPGTAGRTGPGGGPASGGAAGGPPPPPTATVLTSNVGRTMNIVADSMWLYWANYTSSNQNTVVKMPLAGGTPLPLANIQYGGSRVAVGGGSVYWVDGAGAPTDILKVSVDGGMTMTVMSGSNAISRFTVGSDAVYWTIPGVVLKVGLDGGTSTMVGGVQSPGEIVADATGVYWIDGGSIFKAGLQQGADTTLLAQAQSPTNLTLDGHGYLYWVEANDNLMRISTYGGTPESVHYDSANPIRTIAVDASGFYWADSAGTISVGVPGQTLIAPRVLVSNSGFVPGIALDAASVYWIAGTSIYRTPK